MVEKMTIAHLKVESGQKLATMVEAQVAGITLSVPVFLIHGSRPGPRLTVTAGIHGAEYASIEAALRLGRMLQPEQLAGQVVIVAIANPPAFTARSIYVSPPDGKNLNRQFPGFAYGTFSQALAYWLFHTFILPSQAYIDLHGGDLVEALEPFVIFASTDNPEVDRTSRALADVFGITYVLQGETPGSTYQAAARAGIPAILAEAGGQGIWEDEDVTQLMHGVLRCMHQLEMLEREQMPCEPTPSSPPIHLQRWAWLRCEHSGLFYPKVRAGEKVAEGQDIGAVTDPFGRVLQKAIAPMDGIVLFSVTSLAINAGDPLLAIAR